MTYMALLSACVVLALLLMTWVFRPTTPDEMNQDMAYYDR